MRRRRLIGMALAGGMVVILLAVIPAALTPPIVLGSNVAGCSELIVNGGFEQSGAGWQQQPSPPLPLGASFIDPFFPHTGTLGAYLAGRNSATDRLGQTITLPSAPASSGLAFSFWWALSTQEEAGAFDFMKIELYNASGGALITTVLTVDNTSATDWTWTSETFDLTQYAGQTVTLRFTANNDASGNPTAFFLDDVSVSACSSVPAATETPTRTVTPRPTATSTASPSATATHTATRTSMPTDIQTAQPGRRSVYLPLLIRGQG